MPAHTQEFYAKREAARIVEFDEDDVILGETSLFELGFSFTIHGEPLGFVSVAYGEGTGAFHADKLPVVDDATSRFLAKLDEQRKHRPPMPPKKPETIRLLELQVTGAPHRLKRNDWSAVEALEVGQECYIASADNDWDRKYRASLFQWSMYRGRSYATKRFVFEDGRALRITRLK